MQRCGRFLPFGRVERPPENYRQDGLEPQEVSRRRFPSRLAVAALLWLALFALLFTLGSSLGVWPRLPAGAFRDTDLLAGLLFSAFLLLALFRKKPSR